MSGIFIYEDKNEFLSKLQELMNKGVRPEDISVTMPYHVEEAGRILKSRPSLLKYFPLTGAVLGFLAGFGLTIFTALDWPIMTGGKPVVSMPAYLIIAFEMTILFGALAAFLGFLLLAGLPDVRMIISLEENGGKFTVLLKNEK
ncbi:MAG: DUF3341 domain-containing protein [Planctomycetes bacterium]|nr:DUF3341 domain-containing protein [Planctomycetota bacterium]